MSFRLLGAVGTFFIALCAIFSSSPSIATEDTIEWGAGAKFEYPYYRYPRWIPHQSFAVQDGISNAMISPDGSHMIAAYPGRGGVYLEVEATEPEEQEKHLWFRTDSEGLQNVHWLDNEQIVVESRRWRFDRKSGFYPILVLQVFRHNEQSAQLVKQFPMRRADAMVEDLILHTLPAEPNHILIAASPDERKSPAVYKLNITDGSMSMVENRQEGISAWLADHDGNIRFGYGVDDDELKIIARPGAGEKWRNFTDNAVFKSGQFFPVMFDYDNQHMIVRSAAANGRFAFYMLDMQTGRIAHKIFEHPDVDVLDIETSPAQKQLLAVTYMDDRLERHFLNAKYEKLFGMIEKILPNRSNYLLSQSANDRYLLIKSVSDRYPGAIYKLDTRTKEMAVIREINRYLNPRLLAPSTRVNYFARDGLEIPAYLTMPLAPTNQKLPAIVLPHGGPMGRDAADYNRMVQFLASRGYIVLQPNFRGSTGYSFEYQALGYGEWGGKIQDDIEDAVKYLVDDGVADPDRICIIGQNTFDAYSALLGTLERPDLFKCGVAVSPIPDLRNYLKTVKFWYGSGAERAIRGNRKSKELKKASPLTWAEKLSRPLMVLYGDRDWLIPPKDIIKLDEKLKKSGANPLVLIYKGQGHGITNAGARVGFYKRLEEFLAEHLGSPDQSGFSMTAQRETQETSKEMARRRAEVLKSSAQLERCLPKHFEPFILADAPPIKQRIGFCDAYLAEKGESSSLKTRLSLHLTRAKLSYLDDDIKGFSKHLKKARALVSGNETSEFHSAGILTMTALEILQKIADVEDTAAFEQAKTFARDNPDLVPAQTLLMRTAQKLEAWPEFMEALKRIYKVMPFEFGYETFVRNYVRLKQYDKAKNAVENAIITRTKSRNTGVLSQIYAEAELETGNLENAGILLAALQPDRDQAEKHWDQTFPNVDSLTLNDLGSSLRVNEREEVNYLRALYFYETGQPEKAAELVPNELVRCHSIPCWKVDRHYFRQRGNDAEVEALTRVIERHKSRPQRPMSMTSGDWRKNLVLVLPAAPLDALEGKEEQPRLTDVKTRSGNRLLLTFEPQVPTDNFSYLRAAIAQARDVARKHGASAFAITANDLLVSLRDLGFAGGEYDKALFSGSKLEIRLIKNAQAPYERPEHNWLLFGVN